METEEVPEVQARSAAGSDVDRLQWKVLAVELLVQLVLEVEVAKVLEGRPALEADHLELTLPLQLAPHLYPVVREEDPLLLGN